MVNKLHFDRFHGCLAGLAIGDALGAVVEFTEPGTFTPLTDFRVGGSYNLLTGQWTDDTSMALCLAESLIQCRGFEPLDQMQRYLRWYREGYMSSTGSCFDIGNTIRAALERFEFDGNPNAGSADPLLAGNGSLMRLAPVPMFYAADAGAVIEKSAASSLTTHAAAEAVDACRYFGGLIYAALNGLDKETLLGSGFHPTPGSWKDNPLSAGIAEVAGGSFKRRNPPQIRAGGYVVQCLEAALWAFYYCNTFQEGVLLAANLGEDADTCAAVFGQLGGAYFGYQAIPKAWREKIAMAEKIEYFSHAIYSLVLAGSSYKLK